MKTLNFSSLTLLAGFFAVLILTTSCGDSAVGPNTDVDDTRNPFEPPSSENFKIIADDDDIHETEKGYRFKGTLIGINGEGIEFSIGEGEYEVELDANGIVISISGTGLPEFPDIGLYEELLKDFAWSKIESRIEYNMGSYFITKYNTDIPLNPNRLYLHFQVLDESKDGRFELRGMGNNIIYNFYDMYIDVSDPAVFFKIQLWKPGSGNNASDVALKFWKKVSQSLVSMGKGAIEFAGSTNMIVGLSKQGTFQTPEYGLGMKNSDAFRELYGYDRLDSFNSHIFFALNGISIPKTLILRLNGHKYTHHPYEQMAGNVQGIQSALDWFKEGGFYPRTDSYYGSIDFGAKGLQLLLLGVLPAINDITGYDIFNKDIDINLAEAFMQERKPDAQDPGFFRIGGVVKTPVITDLFGEVVNPYLEGMEQSYSNGFLYFGIENELEESSIYLEQSYRLNMPSINPVDAIDSRFLMNKDGITFRNSTIKSIGLLEITSDITGSIHKDGFDLQTSLERNITLPNGIVLLNRGVELELSSQTGVTVTGTIELPHNLGNASLSGDLTTQGLAMSGPMGNTLVYHGQSFTISNSSVNVPRSSVVTSAFNIQLTNALNPRVNGSITQNGYTFNGSNNFSRTVSIPGFNLSGTFSGTINTRITTNGITLSGNGRLLGPAGGELWSGALSIQPNWSNKTIRVCTTGNYDVCITL